MFDLNTAKLTLALIATLSVSWGHLSISWGQSGDIQNRAGDLNSEPETPLRGVALVVGQSKYRHLSALPNPARDAGRLEKLLTQLGFETNTVTNRKARRLRRVL